jgi:hypothetical protein
MLLSILINGKVYNSREKAEPEPGLVRKWNCDDGKGGIHLLIYNPRVELWNAGQPF